MCHAFFLLCLLVFGSEARADDTTRIHHLVHEGKGPADLAELEKLAFAHPESYFSEAIDFADRAFQDNIRMAGLIEIAIRLRRQAPQAFEEFWKKHPVRGEVLRAKIYFRSVPVADLIKEFKDTALHYEPEY